MHKVRDSITNPHADRRDETHERSAPVVLERNGRNGPTVRGRSGIMVRFQLEKHLKRYDGKPPNAALRTAGNGPFDP
jgi:hypothetical protein